MKQHFQIIGSAAYLPAKTITAEDLDKRLGLAPGWTARQTGVLVRHEADRTENGASMAKIVITQALRESRVSLSQIDLIVDASLTVQQPIPCNAALIQEALGSEAAGIPCFDIHASCLGFLAALQMVNGAFASGAARRALIVTAETPLRGVNWKEPESACLMGDGAAAILLEKTETDHPFSARLETFAEGASLCECRGGGHRLPPYDYSPEKQSLYQFHMDGLAVHKLASRKLPPLVKKVLEEAHCRLEDLDVVPHQASGPALELLARRLGIARDRLHSSIADHGNMVAAGMPFVLDRVRRQKPPGTRVMLIGTAAGYTQGAAIFHL